MEEEERQAQGVRRPFAFGEKETTRRSCDFLLDLQRDPSLGEREEENFPLSQEGEEKLGGRSERNMTNEDEKEEMIITIKNDEKQKGDALEDDGLFQNGEGRWTFHLL